MWLLVDPQPTENQEQIAAEKEFQCVPSHLAPADLLGGATRLGTHETREIPSSFELDQVQRSSSVIPHPWAVSDVLQFGMMRPMRTVF